MAKDPRFDPKLLNKKKDERTDEKIVGKEIANNSILTDHIADNAVTSDKISSGAITAGKISTSWPIFNVATSISASNNSRQTYNIVYININNCFSTTTSEFIAPVTGVYHFTWSAIKTDNSAAAVHRQYIRKNTGSGYVNQLGNRHLRLSEGSQYGDATCSAILELNKGDKIDIYIANSSCGSYPASEYTWFQGYLIR